MKMSNLKFLAVLVVLGTLVILGQSHGGDTTAAEESKTAEETTIQFRCGCRRGNRGCEEGECCAADVVRGSYCKALGEEGDRCSNRPVSGFYPGVCYCVEPLKCRRNVCVWDDDDDDDDNDDDDDK